MNAGAVITNHEQKLKIGHVFGEEVMPKFSILNPKFTFSLPKRQMVVSAVSLPYYRYIMPYGVKKFKRFAEEAWNVWKT